MGEKKLYMPLMGIGIAIAENCMEVPDKTKNGTSIDPAIPFLDMYLKGNEIRI